jgi:hypothetical protein
MRARQISTGVSAFTFTISDSRSGVFSMTRPSLPMPALLITRIDSQLSAAAIAAPRS